MAIKKRKPKVVAGGKAIPIGKNYYYMKGRKHEQGGIDVGANPKTGLEVEDGEVMHISKDNVKVFSSVPILNGKSPAEKVMGGENPNKVFKAQENFKDRNNLNDDGSRVKAMGGMSKTNTTGHRLVEINIGGNKRLIRVPSSTGGRETAKLGIRKVQAIKADTDYARDHVYNKRPNKKVEEENDIEAINKEASVSKSDSKSDNKPVNKSVRKSDNNSKSRDLVESSRIKGTDYAKNHNVKRKNYDSVAKNVPTYLPNRRNTPLRDSNFTTNPPIANDRLINGLFTERVDTGNRNNTPTQLRNLDFQPIENTSFTDILEGAGKDLIQSLNAPLAPYRPPHETPQFNDIGALDYIGLGANTVGSIMSGITNRRMLKDLKYSSAPTPVSAAKFKTRININPQIDKIRENVNRYYRDVDANTASSRVALARKQRASVDAMLDTNELYSKKENAETQLINQDKANQQAVNAANIQQYNRWAAGKSDFENKRREALAENTISTLEGINFGVQDVIDRIDSRKNANRNLSLISLVNPNVTGQMAKESGFQADYYRRDGESVKDAKRRAREERKGNRKSRKR